MWSRTPVNRDHYPHPIIRKINLFNLASEKPLLYGSSQFTVALNLFPLNYLLVDFSLISELVYVLTSKCLGKLFLTNNIGKPVDNNCVEPCTRKS